MCTEQFYCVYQVNLSSTQKRQQRDFAKIFNAQRRRLLLLGWVFKHCGCGWTDTGSFYGDKVDTTNRCEALKEVMSLNYAGVVRQNLA